ncbi:potassium channel family protein [Rhodothermus marinus]|uniref:potassium channel family protein n=1 Tax=Rhodothermus marinus TaxID=29549 RepID=UPI0037C67965
MAAPGRLLDRLLHWIAHAESEQREILLGSLLLLFIMLGGTIGYRIIEGWTWIEAFYMTFITLTTIGFSEVRPLSEAGRLFTVFVALAGIGTVAFIATRMVQFILSSTTFRDRYLRRKLRAMHDHFIVCGYGRVGKRIVEDLLQAGRPVVVIERAEEELEELRAAHLVFVAGDAEEEETLRRAGIDRARALILALADDSANVFVTLLARELNPNVFILARTNDHKNMRKLLRAGANKVIAPSEVGADRMAQVVLRPHVDAFMERVLGTGALGLQMEEIRIEPGAPLAGKTLAESNFRQHYNAIVVAIVDGQTSEIRYNPGADARLQAGDILIVLGIPEAIEKLQREGCRAP